MSDQAFQFGVGSSDFAEEIPVHDTIVDVRFVRFSRTKDGGLVRKPALKWGYEEREGAGGQEVWKRESKDEVPAAVVQTMTIEQKSALTEEGGKYFIKAPPVRVPLEQVDDLWEEKIYMQFEVVKPFDKAGAECPLSRRLKGIKLLSATSFEMMFEGGRISGLAQTLMDCGIKASGFNPKSPTHDVDYLMPYLGMLEAPLSKEQILLTVIEPLLVQAAESGVLLEAKTFQQSNFLNYATVKPLTESEAEQVRAEAAQYGVAPEPSIEETTPFPSDVPEVDLGGLRTQVKEGVTAEGKTGGDVYGKLKEWNCAPATTSHILDHLDAETLRRLLDWLNEGEASL